MIRGILLYFFYRRASDCYKRGVAMVGYYDKSTLGGELGRFYLEMSHFYYAICYELLNKEKEKRHGN